jgi:hypothetical protein
MTLPWDTATSEEIMQDLINFKKKWFEAGASNQFDVLLPIHPVHLTLLDDCEHSEVECGIEHPNLEGNYCVLNYDHKDLHEDLAGNNWYGRP